MSDTPRTTEATFTAYVVDSVIRRLDCKVVHATEAAKIERQLNEAIALLAGWCDAVANKGTGWDDWDEFYKDARYRPGPLRELIDAAMVAICDHEWKRQDDSFDHEYGTEQVHYWLCEKCEATKPMEAADDHPDEP